MAQPPAVNITMPVFNRPELTDLAIRSLRKGAGSIPFTLTVVDNGSEAPLVAWLREQHKAGLIDKLFLLPRNMGISCACNIGWEMTDAPFYCKLDNDIFIQSPDWLEKLFRLWSHGLPLSNLGPAWTQKGLVHTEGFLETPDGTLGICRTNLPGCSIFIPKAVSDILGCWSEDYGLYGAEDGDYALRMDCAGFPQYLYLAPGLLRHMGERQTGFVDQYEKHGLDRVRENRALFQSPDGGVGLFPLNHYLFNACIRNWKVPRKYEVADVDSRGHVNLREREEFAEVMDAILLCKRKVDEIFRRTGSFDPIYEPDFVAELKEIMARCGQAMPEPS